MKLGDSGRLVFATGRFCVGFVDFFQVKKTTTTTAKSLNCFFTTKTEVLSDSVENESPQGKAFSGDVSSSTKKAFDGILLYGYGSKKDT